MAAAIFSLQALLAEFVGTFFLVLTIVLSGGRSSVPGQGDHAYIAIGLTLAAMIYGEKRSVVVERKVLAAQGHIRMLID